MPDYAVSTAFTAQDKFSKQFMRMEKSAGKFGRTATSSFGKASRAGIGLKSVMGGILAAGAVQRGIGLMNQGMGSVVRQFVEFDDAIMAAGARFTDIGPNAKNFQGQLEAIKKSARDAGATTEFTAAQAAGALDFLARAGFTSADAMGSLGSMINLATATGEDFNRVADISSDLLGAFGAGFDKNISKVEKLNRLNDVLVKTTNSANVTVENMFDTMKQVGPVATGVLGASLEEVAALTGVLGNSGIKGSDAMTALKNAYLRLAAPVGEGADILKKLNITLDDGEGGARKMTDVMAEMGTKLKDLGAIPGAEILDAVFGKRAIAGGKNIIDNIANINAFEQSLLSAAGTSQKTAEIMRKSWGNRLKSLGSAATELGFKFLDAFSVDGKSGIESLTASLRAFDMKPIIDGMKTFIGTIQFLHNMLKPFYGSILIVVGGLTAYSVIMKTIMALQAAKAFFTFISVLRAVTGAQTLLNLAMIANPIGAVVAGITAAIAIGYLLVKNWDLVKQSFQAMSDAILGNRFFTGMALLFAPWFAIPALIIKHWEPIRAFFDDLAQKAEAVANIFGAQQESQVQASTGIQGMRGMRGVVPPNRQEEQARRSTFSGRIDIGGAPEGTTVESASTGGAGIDMALLGAN